MITFILFMTMLLLPDLTVKNFKVERIEITGRPYICVTGKLINVGNIPATWAGVGVRIEGYSYVYTSTQTLGPGSVFPFKWYFAPRQGVWKVKAMADPYNYVIESNENNNNKIRQVKV